MSPINNEASHQSSINLDDTEGIIQAIPSGKNSFNDEFLEKSNSQENIDFNKQKELESPFFLLQSPIKHAQNIREDSYES